MSEMDSKHHFRLSLKKKLSEFRDALKSALRGLSTSHHTASTTGGGASTSSPQATPKPPVAAGEGPKKRVAIIGGGAGGLAAAYFLAGVADVELFESRAKIGGHCDSEVVNYKGQKIVVDLGAQFFHPDTHPLYVTLLEQLGLYSPDHPDSDQTLQAPGSLCMFPVEGGWPLLSSAKAFLTPAAGIEFAIYTQLARQAILDDMSWEIT